MEETMRTWYMYVKGNKEQCVMWPGNCDSERLMTFLKCFVQPIGYLIRLFPLCCGPAFFSRAQVKLSFDKETRNLFLCHFLDWRTPNDIDTRLIYPLSIFTFKHQNRQKKYNTPSTFYSFRIGWREKRFYNMSGHPFAYSSAPVRRVAAVQFGILSPEEIVCFQSSGQLLTHWL